MTTLTRATVATTTLALVLATPVSAQESPVWPSVTELRARLAVEADWIWGATGNSWRGGHRLETFGNTTVREVDGRLSLEVWVSPDDVFELFLQDKVGTGWTAFMEVASRLPVPVDTTNSVLEQIEGEDGSCHAYPVEDGIVIAYFDGYNFELVINERGVDDCDQRVESQAALEQPTEEAVAAAQEDQRAAMASDAP